MKIDLNHVISVLEGGGLVVFPTDTVYGLLCDATNSKAVENLISFKQRPAGKPISVFMADLEMGKKYVDISDEVERKLKTLLPGPYTIILSSKHRLVKELESEKGTLGIRIPDNENVLELVRRFGRPITATSANLASQPPHYSLDSFKAKLPIRNDRALLVTLMVDGGKLPYNKPSTVVDFTTDDLKVLRMGDKQVARSKQLISRSEKETKEIAKNLLNEVEEVKDKSEKPIVFILQGDLGAGKTIFAKGLGDALGIENIISPTFVVYYEYPFKNGKFIHVDLYNVSDKEEFKHLGLQNYLKPGNIMCIEWGEKSGEIIQELENKTRVIYVTIEHKKESVRTITVNYSL